MHTTADRDAGRALVADRARSARAALHVARAEQRHGDRSSEAAAGRARRALDRYAASSRELAGSDRFGRRVAQAWLETARAALWFGTEECAQAEALAFGYLQALPAGGCPRGAVRRVRRSHRAGLRRWHATHSAHIAALAARVRRLG